MELNKLYLVRGISGSGKTTLAHSLSEGEYPVFAADDYFYDENGEYKFDPQKLGHAHGACYDKVKDALSKGTKKVFVTNTFTKESELNPYIKLGKEMGYEVHTLIVENRHESGDVHGVPDHAKEKQRGRFSVKL